jgi:hypothetical protein
MACALRAWASANPRCSFGFEVTLGTPGGERALRAASAPPRVALPHGCSDLQKKIATLTDAVLMLHR